MKKDIYKTYIDSVLECVKPMMYNRQKNNMSLCGNGSKCDTRLQTHIFFIILHRTSNKGNDPHLVVLSLSVFQGQLRRKKHKYGHSKTAAAESKTSYLPIMQLLSRVLLLRLKQTIKTRNIQVTHMSHSDACAEADLSFGLDSVEFGQDAARIWCQCGQDLTVTA